MRYEPDRMIIESYMDAVRRHDPGLDRRAHPDLDYVKRAFRRLLED